MSKQKIINIAVIAHVDAGKSGKGKRNYDLFQELRCFL